jgi:nicotinamide-nucleotide amidase
LLCFGISEAKLGEVLADLMVRGRNPMVGATASEAVLSVRVVTFGRDKSAAQQLADRDIREIRHRLGSVVFGEGAESLELVVGCLLRDRGATLSTAESCTGGLLAAKITDVPGSSDYFVRGLVTYSDQSKTELLGVSRTTLEAEGAVSEAVAKAMAEGCRRISQTDYALAITGLAGPSGGTPDKPVGLVYLALADTNSVVAKRVLFGSHPTRQEIRDRSCKTAMNMLRLRLLGEPVD